MQKLYGLNSVIVGSILFSVFSFSALSQLNKEINLEFMLFTLGVVASGLAIYRGWEFLKGHHIFLPADSLFKKLLFILGEVFLILSTITIVINISAGIWVLVSSAKGIPIGIGFAITIIFYFLSVIFTGIGRCNT